METSPKDKASSKGKEMHSSAAIQEAVRLVSSMTAAFEEIWHARKEKGWT